jgi:hypothetical protein
MRLLAFLLICGALPAAAQSPLRVAAGPQGQVEISGEICTALGADADYRAGVDVGGHPVAPADLPNRSPSLGLGEAPIEINSRFAGRFGVPAAGGAYDAKAILGYVTVREGRAFFNGTPLEDDANAAIIAACHQRK